MNNKVEVSFTIDGKKQSFLTETDRRLLDVLRTEAGKTCVREGCGEGECGACSVMMDGKLINSCTLPVIAAEGSEITTIEGFSETREYEIISAAFAECGAVQCGFCTPGFILAAAALLRETPSPSDEEIRTALSGNLCRCTGYTMIIDAVRAAAERMRDEKA